MEDFLAASSPEGFKEGKTHQNTQWIGTFQHEIWLRTQTSSAEMTPNFDESIWWSI